MKNTVLTALAVLIIIGVLVVVYIVATAKPARGTLGDVHYHADFMVYLNGVPYNFSEEKYMSNDTAPLSPFLHLHDMDGTVIHMHMSGVTIGEFFSSLKMTFNSTCFALDNGTSYCNSGDNTLKMYVMHVTSDNSTKTLNYGPWESNYDYGGYVFSDLDKILITYGNDSNAAIAAQESSVGNRACLYSVKCPWLGALDVNESSCIAGPNGGCAAVP